MILLEIYKLIAPVKRKVIRILAIGIRLLSAGGGLDDFSFHGFDYNLLGDQLL